MARDNNAYLGPVKPIFVPTTPLNFTTTNLSRNIFASTVSEIIKQAKWDYKTIITLQSQRQQR